MDTIVISWDPNEIFDSALGCYKANFLNNSMIQESGATAHQALQNFLSRAQSFGFSGLQESYKIVYPDESVPHIRLPILLR